MAEKAAHLTSTVHPKPSIFEIIAQDSLNATIHPALQKIILFLTSYNSRRYNWLIDYCDEIYLAVNSVIQYHYIKNYDASFSEHFYGLKRIPIKGDISLNDRKFSLLFLVVLPYFKIKIEEKLAQCKLDIADGTLTNNWKTKLKKLLCSTQTILYLCWNFWSIAQYLKYMSGNTDIQLPSLKLLQLKLTYAEINQNNDGFWSNLFKGHLMMSQFNTGLIGQTFQNTLEFAAFFMQFLKSWQTEKSHVNITALPTPEPPEYDQQSTTYKRKCPICMQQWIVPTIVSVSGYIYCFRCIIRHLQETKTCPVTHLPCTISDIVRLYDNKTE